MRLTLAVNPRKNKASWNCRFNAFLNVTSEESGCKKVPKDSSEVNCSFPPSPSNGTANSFPSIKKSSSWNSSGNASRPGRPPCHNIIVAFSPTTVLHITQECPVDTSRFLQQENTPKRPTAQLSLEQPGGNLLLPYSRAGTGDCSKGNSLPSKALARDGS